MYKTILFDLDGTLTDPGIGITNSAAYALKKFDIPVPERRELYRFIGPPLRDSFMEFYGFSRKKADLAIEYYREYYRDAGIFENKVYPGIPKLLKSLKDEGKHLIVATSKPELFSRQIINHFDLAGFFDDICGSDMAEIRVQKADIITYALNRSKSENLSDCVMIGDRKHDILGASAVGIHSIGVLYGYGTREELTAAGAEKIAKTVDELNGILE